jgi:hypothetical protein
MLARLGHQLYWLCYALAGLALVSGVFLLQHGLDYDNRWLVYVASVGSAVVCWLLGRAANTFWPVNEPVASAPIMGIPVAAKGGGREPKP